MKNFSIILSVIVFALASLNTFAQKAADFVGTWKPDYEATKALMSEKDKAEYTEEVEKMIKPMMEDMRYVFVKGGEFQLMLKTDKITKDGAKWTLKGKNLIINFNNGLPAKPFEIKEASKTKIVWYDKEEKGGFKTTVLVPAQ